MYLSIIIPAYNEEQNLKNGNLSEITGFLKSQSFSWEIILVNDGSSDNTLNYLKNFTKATRGVKLIDNPHRGKAVSIITGVSRSKGNIVLFMDMDQSTPLSEFSKFIGRFESGYDVVIGTRSKRAGAPFFRQILAYGMIILRTLILRLPFRDTQCGFKAFTRDCAATIFPKLAVLHPVKSIDYPSTNPGFDIEILYLARKLGYKIAQVPVVWNYRESQRVSFVKDSINGLRELLLVRYRSLTGKYL